MMITFTLKGKTQPPRQAEVSIAIVKFMLLLILICFFNGTSGAQTNPFERESLTKLSDSIIRNEMISFTLKGKTQSSKQIGKLMEIPIRHCSETTVHLGYSTFFSSISTFIHLYFKNEPRQGTLDSIFLVTHSHFHVRLPRDAFEGIVASNGCAFEGGKQGKLFSPYYRSFYSADKQRLYIYMQATKENQQCEITWVVVGDRYYTRVVDVIDNGEP
jgi:hypothetical protein